MDPTGNRTTVDEARRYAKTIMDSLSAHIAIIDRDGVILETNLAWKRFAQSNQVSLRPDMLGVNYLDVCAAAHVESEDGDPDVAQGIRRVIDGTLEEFVVDYPCHSPDEQRWFYMRAIRAVGAGPLRVVISHENITPLKKIQIRLKEREDRLEQNSARLKEVNAALRAILRQREEDKHEMEQAIIQNLREGVGPYLESLKQSSRTEGSRELIDVIESRLNDVISPFLRRLADWKTVLTPREIQIAALIREGKTTKEIALLLNVSLNTVKFHRRSLRDKLNLKNSSNNLRAYLLSLEKG